jgi:hypothetical protein
LNANVTLISHIVNVLTPRNLHLGPNDLKTLFGEMDSESIVPSPFSYHSVFPKNITLFRGVLQSQKQKTNLCAHMFSELRFRSVVHLKRKAKRSSFGHAHFVNPP